MRQFTRGITRKVTRAPAWTSHMRSLLSLEAVATCVSRCPHGRTTTRCVITWLFNHSSVPNRRSSALRFGNPCSWSSFSVKLEEDVVMQFFGRRFHYFGEVFGDLSWQNPKKGNLIATLGFWPLPPYWLLTKEIWPVYFTSVVMSLPASMLGGRMARMNCTFLRILFHSRELPDQGRDKDPIVVGISSQYCVEFQQSAHRPLLSSDQLWMKHPKRKNKRESLQLYR